MYQALYRKWRPKTFDDVISQPHITKTLQSEIKSGRIAHAYLFTGSRGTGKTTCARIFAKAVNCQNLQEDGNPCLECEACLGIEKGSILDIVEIDAASNNSVDDIRDLREEANFTPSVVKYRGYIIDEVHMLSNSAFNALLKIMEEPPAHVIFILATTEVHKVPATILSRCQRFDFRRALVEDIRDMLLKIAKEEDIDLTDEAAELIARLADGGVRDSLSLLDQCIAFSDNIDAETVSRATGTAGREYLFRLVNAVRERSASEAVEIIDELYGQSKDLTRLCEEMVTMYRNLMIIKTVREPRGLVRCMASEWEELQKSAENYPLSEILFVISELQGSLERLARAPGKRTEMELCFIRLCTPELSASNDAVIARLEALERLVRAGGLPAPAEMQTIPKENPVKPPQPESHPRIQPEDIPEPEPLFPAGNAEPVSPVKNEEMPSAEPEASTANTAEDSAASNALAEVTCWGEILENLAEMDAPLRGVLAGSRAFIQGDAFCIDSPNSMLGMMLKQNGAAKRLSAAIQQQMGRKYRLMLRPPEGGEQKNTPDPLQALEQAAREHGVDVITKED